MRRWRWRDKPLLLGMVLAAILPHCAAARTLHASVQRIEAATLVLEQVALTLREAADGAGEAEVVLAIADLRAPAWNLRLRQVQWQCRLARVGDAGEERVQCRGPLRARDAGRFDLVATREPSGLRFELVQREARLELRVRSGGAPLSLQVDRVPLTWLQPLVAAGWDGGRITAGRLDAGLDIEIEDGAARVEGTFDTRDLGVDSDDGSIATAALGVAGSLALRADERRIEVESDLTLRGGELLFGSLYTALPSTPITLGLGAQRSADGRWRASRLRWDDPGVLVLGGTGTLAPGTDGHILESADLRLDSPALDLARRRYLESLLGTWGLPAATLKGAAGLEMEWSEGQARRVAARFDAMDADSGDGRFAFRGVDGELDWGVDEARREGALSWRSASLHGITLGSVTLPLRSRAGRIEMRAPVEIEVLGGTVGLQRAGFRPGMDAGGVDLDLALSLRALDLAALSAVLQWPPFQGRLSGDIPGVRYADRVLVFEGGLHIGVFDGAIDIAQLSLERPFGVAPTLSAEIAMRGLDLQPLTAAFGFGEITGRLDGDIRGLRLIDWSPVAFDAYLHSTPNARGPRRISQRAVKDLTSVGGGGFIAGLQGQVLKVFDTFGYARIGLRCRLANNVCRMGGIDSSGNGYTIVEGAGLPRVTVVGHQRQVDWPVLLARLKAATEGQMPVVE